MIGNVPPRLVTWLLEHLVPCGSSFVSLQSFIRNLLVRQGARQSGRHAVPGDAAGYTAVLLWPFPPKNTHPSTIAPPDSGTLRNRQALTIPFAHSPLPAFNHITVDLRPIAGASTRGARVSILRFTLIPR